MLLAHFVLKNSFDMPENWSKIAKAGIADIKPVPAFNTLFLFGLERAKEDEY